jgi:hypothetical protein
MERGVAGSVRLELHHGGARVYRRQMSAAPCAAATIRTPVSSARWSDPDARESLGQWSGGRHHRDSGETDGGSVALLAIPIVEIISGRNHRTRLRSLGGSFSTDAG